MSNPEIQVVLDRFKLRWYQSEPFDLIENGLTKRLLYIAPRRAGKDILGWNLAIRQCIRKTCLVYYVLPTFKQARACIWDAITIDGMKFLDFVPPQLIAGVNQSEMKIRFKNDSILQCIGGDTYDTSLVGTNPFAVILSEYALMPADIFSFIRPILAANGGWCLVVSTPRGKNHLWQLFKIAQELPDWKVIKQTASEIQHISDEILAQERAQMDEGLYLQEYETSFERGIQGSYYGTYLDALKLKGQICDVPWEPGLQVHTAWDIGVNDATTIVFFQTVDAGAFIRIIDFYMNNNQGLDHYAKIIQDKPYRYGKHFGPHDLAVREWSGGCVTRYEKAHQIGIEFELLPQIGVMDGIENVWTHFSKFWIDQTKCRTLINAMENYRKEWDEKKQIYSNKPVHNWASDPCFIGNTKISMADGELSIENVRPGMMVRTPFGLRKVLDVHKRTTTELYDITVNKKHLICTGSHKIFTQRGLVRTDALRYTDILEPLNTARSYIWRQIYGLFMRKEDLTGFKTICISLKMERKSFLMGDFLDYMEIITAKSQDHCIERSGSFIKAKYHPDLKFIISTKTLKIISLKIFNCFQRKNIMRCIYRILTGRKDKRKILCNSQVLEINQKNGMVVNKGLLGIGDMHINLYQQLKGLNINVDAACAKKNLTVEQKQQNTVQVGANLSIVGFKEKILRNALVVFVRGYSFVTNIFLRRHVVKNVARNQVLHQEHVYDLTIENDNCYYANGYLVSNCDAVRYMCQAIHKTKRGMTSEEFDRAKAEALYGSKNQLPRFFNNDPRYDRY
jgi:phage terminase large subunit